MSQRNSLENKKRRRVAKQMRKLSAPPAHIDLIDYIQMRTRCTTGMAKKVLLADSVRADSHILGYQWTMNAVQGKNVKVLNPYVTDDVRGRIEFHMPDD